MSHNVSHLHRQPVSARIRQVLIGSAFAFLCSVSSLAAGGISGTYADKGVVVQSVNAATTAEISFHGLLGQQFDPQLAALDFETSDRVTLDETDGTLTVEIFDDEGQRIWRSRWGASRGFSMEDGKAVIRMRMKNSKDDRWVLVMDPNSDDRALMVQVFHVKPGTFGPHSEPVGTYIFAREG